MGKKILVIDDSQQARDMIAAALKAEGYDTNVAVNFEEFIQKARSTPPDLAVIDVVMPDVSGFDACAKIKALNPSRLVKVIMMTGKLDAIDPVRARMTGADDFVVKTSDMGALVKAVKKLID